MWIRWIKLCVLVLICFCSTRLIAAPQPENAPALSADASSTSLEAQSLSFLNKLLLKPRSSTEYLVALLASFVVMSFVLLKMHDSAQAKNISWIMAMGNLAVVTLVLVAGLTIVRLHFLPGWEKQLTQWSSSTPASSWSAIAQSLSQAPSSLWIALTALGFLIFVAAPTSKLLFASSYSGSLLAWLATIASGCIVVYAVHFGFGLGATADQINQEKQQDKTHSADQFLKEM